MENIRDALAGTDLVEEAMEPSVTLGDTVKDKLSYFNGVAIGFASYLYEMDQVLIVAPSLGHDGKPVTVWLPLAQVELVKEKE